MYLKEIKISGFKSFADKIALSLDDKITCIVGPNGSGKSNIVDAVRWVLGEQSIKSLRGDNTMTDVIFSGSKSRDSLNLATVTLTFDNSDSYIKTPYTEISVTRKVYKNGDNEYYINNEKCRLKDISELFLDSGMGKESFNIISQGEIGKIISDSSQDRRIILEEVAGVLKYKKRKEEALRRLDKTSLNLTRIQDIIKELEIQIEPLKEQSKKAKEYLEIKNNLEAIDISLIIYDLEKMNFEYQQNKEKIEIIENELITLNTNFSTSDIDLDLKSQELLKLETLYVDFNTKLMSLIKEEEKLKGEKNIAKERSKYTATDAKIYENISNLKEQELKINNDLVLLAKDIDLLDENIENNSKEFNLKKNKLSEIVNNKNELESIINEKNQKVINLSYKIKTLQEYINSLGNTNTSVKRILSNPKIRGLHSTLANLIKIKENYTLALEVSMGGAKDYVIVDTKEVAKTCINYLKDNNLGRVTFYPLEVIKPRGIDFETLDLIKKEDGYIGILADLITYDEKYYNIIYNQFGTTIIANNLDNANAMSKKISNKYKIVTLTGEVVNAGGSITGGSVKQTSIISEKYELQNLIREEELLISELRESEKHKEELKDKEISLREEFIKYANEDIRLRSLITNIKSQYEEKTALHKNILKELEDLENISNETFSSEEENLMNRYYTVIKHKEEIIKEMNKISKEKEHKEAIIEQLQADYRINNVKIRELETKLKDYEISTSKVEVKMDSLLNILTDNYSMTYEKAKTNYILEIDPEIARRQVHNYRSEMKSIGNVNLGSIEEYERISNRYNFLLNQGEDLNKASEILLKIVKELDEVMEKEFTKTFKEVEVEFTKTFKDLFGGGTATLRLTDPSNILETGVEIIATPPGKKLTTISLLSGGEKTLTAISLLFAILNVKKVPFCLFDEVEAALDEANVDNFGKYLENYRNKTQFLLITHKKRTMEYADTLYGITMQESGVSKLVSVKLVEK